MREEIVCMGRDSRENDANSREIEGNTREINRLRVDREEKGRVIGCVTFCHDAPTVSDGSSVRFPPDCVYIRYLGVHPDVRGKRLGEILMHACMERARDMGKKHLVMLCVYIYIYIYTYTYMHASMCLSYACMHVCMYWEKCERTIW